MTIDPRLVMADTYRVIGNNKELSDKFTREIAKCSGPDDAIDICLRYQELGVK